ncbi:MAG: hypothetical protein ABSD68_03280 [Candidatus Micrarchaeales archaeon]|jgi:hypothetical protein
MNFKKWKPIISVVLFWVTFKLVSFLFGFSPWPDITQLALLSETFPFISALGFGFWIGVESYKDFNLMEAIRNSVIIAFLIGCLELTLLVVLVNTSTTFLVYALAIYPTEVNAPIPLLDLVISTWIGGMFIAVPTTAVGYRLMNKISKK